MILDHRVKYSIPIFSHLMGSPSTAKPLCKIMVLIQGWSGIGAYRIHEIQSRSIGKMPIPYSNLDCKHYTASRLIETQV